MEKIQMGKEYRTRDGCPVRILAVDRKDSCYPVVALVGSPEDVEYVMTYSSDGFWQHRTSDCSDLVPVPQKHVWWINFYNNRTDFVVHFSKEEADAYASKGRTACVRVEFEEGQFDE